MIDIDKKFSKLPFIGEVYEDEYVSQNEKWAWFINLWGYPVIFCFWFFLIFIPLSFFNNDAFFQFSDQINVYDFGKIQYEYDVLKIYNPNFADDYFIFIKLHYIFFYISLFWLLLNSFNIIYLSQKKTSER